MATRKEPYVLVSGCDGCGAFSMYGVHPRKRGDFAIYAIIGRIAEGVRDGFIFPSSDTDLEEKARFEGNFVTKITVPEAMALFVDSLVERTEKMPKDAVAVIRWFEKSRRPGPHRFQDLVQPDLSDEELAAIGEKGTMESAMKYFSGSGSVSPSNQLQMELLSKHSDEFEKYVVSPAGEYLRRYWWLEEGNLEEMGVTRRCESWCNSLMMSDKLIKCPRLVQRYVLMTAHMRMLHTLAGNERLANLWSRELGIQLDAFIDSGLRRCLIHQTNGVLQHISTLPGKKEYHFHDNVEGEQLIMKLLRVVKHITAAHLFLDDSTPTHQERTFADSFDSLWGDLILVTNSYMGVGIQAVIRQARSRIPGLESVLEDCLCDQLQQLLFQHYFHWVFSVLSMRESPFTRPVKDPPQELVSEIRDLLGSDSGLEKYSGQLSCILAQAFWNTACTADHPENFDFPLEKNGGWSVRKASPFSPQHLITGMSLPTLVFSYADAMCCDINWVQQVGQLDLDVREKMLTVSMHPDEVHVVSRTLCPRYYRLEGSRLVPSSSFVESCSLSNSGAKYFSTLVRLAAKIAPLTTVNLLVAMAEIHEELAGANQALHEKLEKRKHTSTIKQKSACISCGSSAKEKGKLLKCSRCKIGRYCSVECQRKNYKFHKKICQPVSKQQG